MQRLLVWLSLLLFLTACHDAHTDSLLEQALNFIDDGKVAEAIPILEQVLPKVRDPDERNLIRYVLGNAYRHQGEWQKAIQVYRAALETEKELAPHLTWHLAEAYEALDDLEHAAETYRELLQRYPSYSRGPSARYRLARAELELKRYQAVIDLYMGLHEKPGREAQFLLAQAKEELERWGDAYRGYQAILAANPSDDLAEKSYERILLLLTHAPSLRPSRAERLQHARVMLAFRQFTEGRQVLRKVVGTHRDKLAGQATYLIAQSYVSQRQYDRAIREYAKIRDRYSGSGYLTRALYQTALLYRRKGEVNKSNRLLLEFAETYSWSLWADNALYEVGQAEQRHKRYQSAIQAYRKLIRRYTRSSLVDDALWNAGWCHYKLGQLSESQHTFQELARRFPGTDLGNAGQYWLGKIHERLEAWDAAARTYRQIVEEHDWYYAIRARERLERLIQEGKISGAPPASPQLVTDPPKTWEDVQQPPLPSLPRLLKARGYEDAFADLQAALRGKEASRASIYYYLIVSAEKMHRYRDATLYAYRLSRLDGFRDAQGRIPRPLFERLYPLYYQTLINTHAEKANLDPMFVAAMIREESRYQEDIVSHAGAIGLMQIMPATAREIAQRLRLRGYRTALLTRAEINIRLGTWYMGQLMEQFERPELVAGAYNGGPGRVQRWMKEMNLEDIDEFIEDVPFTETRNHIKRVMHSYGVYRQLYGS